MSYCNDKLIFRHKSANFQKIFPDNLQIFRWFRIMDSDYFLLWPTLRWPWLAQTKSIVLWFTISYFVRKIETDWFYPISLKTFGNPFSPSFPLKCMYRCPEKILGCKMLICFSYCLLGLNCTYKKIMATNLLSCFCAPDLIFFVRLGSKPMRCISHYLKKIWLR